MSSDSSSLDSLFPDSGSASAVIADVLIPLALDTAYSYTVPKGLSIKAGDVVHVPLGTRETLGVVWETRSGAAASNLKAVIGQADAPPIGAKLRDFVDWVARYTLSPRGSVLRMTLRGPEIERPERIVLVIIGDRKSVV